jgi:FKBP-type peptidyl-prolyl cis-trans isomerase SlpA
LAELKITDQCEVVLHYHLALEDGTLVDATTPEAPLIFTTGDGTLTPALEAHLYGLQEGEKAHFIIAPGVAWPIPDRANHHLLPRSQFAPHLDICPGNIIEFDLPSGEAIAGTVVAAKGESVIIDFNHPLAGKQVTFKVEVIEIRPLCASGRGDA